MRFYRNVFHLSHACHAFLSECLAFGSYLSCVPIEMSCVRFTPAVCRLCAKQDALRDVAFLFRRGSGSPFVRSRMSRGYRTWLVYFGLARFFMAIPTENEGTRRTESAARQSAFLRDHIGFAVFSAGSTLGQKVEAALRPRPRLRQGDSSPWTLFI